jgi:hypothetical protein
MRLARSDDVVGVMALAGDEAEIFLAANRGADSGRTHGLNLPETLVYSAACRAAPDEFPMARAPAWIALTMLW